MKNFFQKPFLFILAVLVLPAALLAQTGDKDKNDKDKVKEEKEKKRNEQIIITRTGTKDEKIVVEVNGDKVTVNGKPIEEYKGDNVIVGHKGKDYFTLNDGQNSWAYGGNDNFKFYSVDSNRAMLGVTTE